MPVGRQKRLAITQRRQRVAELHLASWTQQAIAAELGLSQSTVSTDLKAIEKEWRDSTVRDFDLARAMDLQKLNHLEREIRDALQRSQEPIESTRVIQNGSERRVERCVTQQHCDRRYFELILRVFEDRRKLLGLDRIAPTSPDGQESHHPISIDWDKLREPTDPMNIDNDPIEQAIRAAGK